MRLLFMLVVIRWCDNSGDDMVWIMMISDHSEDNNANTTLK